MFFDSQAAVEKAHITAAFRFELSKVGVAAIRERMLSSLVNFSGELAAEIAAGFGMKVPAMDEDPGVLLADGADAAGVTPAFIDAVAAHRNPSRDSDPPLI